MTNYHCTDVARMILYNTTVVDTMSFFLCLHHVGSVAFAQIHPLPSPSLFVHKLDQYFVEFYDLNLGWHV